MSKQRPIILNQAERDWETWDDPDRAAKSPVRWKILISGERGPSSRLIICGGKLSTPQFISEQYMLDLEHEVFLNLCGEQETHARIEATLQRGKK